MMTKAELEAALAAAEEHLAAVQREVDSTLGTLQQLNLELLAAQLAVRNAQSDLDNYVPPPDDPDQFWPKQDFSRFNNFRTPPPENIEIRQHPRLLVTSDNREELAAKYKAHDWNLKNDVFHDALKFVLFDDAAAGQRAKDALLSVDIDFIDPAEGKDGNLCLYWMFVYDWCFPLFTEHGEREYAMTVCMKYARLTMPSVDGDDDFDVLRFEDQIGNGSEGFFGNDRWQPYDHMIAFLWRGVTGLCFYGDGVRDRYCEYIVHTLQHNVDARINPVYDPKRGGTVDTFNALALDSGGNQAGNHGDPVTGYTGMFTAGGALVFLAIWDSATGDKSLHKCEYWYQLPHWIAYDIGPGEDPGANEAHQTLRQCAGVYFDDLAAWLCDKYGDGKYRELETFLLGRKDIDPQSPEQLGHPTSAYLNGADKFYSMSSWDDDATRIVLFTRSTDVGRYEHSPGALRLSKGDAKGLITFQDKKGPTFPCQSTSIRIRRRGQPYPGKTNNSTYWGGKHLLKSHGRIAFPSQIADDWRYQGAEPTENHGGEDWHCFTHDSAGYWSDGQEHLPVRKCKRTVVHLKPVDGREFLVLCDRVDVPPELEHCWGARFINAPKIVNNQFRASFGKYELIGTVLCDAQLEVRGGTGNITEGPDGEHYKLGNFHDNGNISQAGAWSLYLKQSGDRYIVAFEIGSTNFMPSTVEIEGSVVSLGGWTVDLSAEDQTKVMR